MSEEQPTPQPALDICKREGCFNDVASPFLDVCKKHWDAFTFEATIDPQDVLGLDIESTNQ